MDRPACAELSSQTFIHLENVTWIRPLANQTKSPRMMTIKPVSIMVWAMLAGPMLMFISPHRDRARAVRLREARRSRAARPTRRRPAC